MRSQPLLVVRDVDASTRFYRRLLGCSLGGGDRSGHHGDGPREYERLYDPTRHHSEWGSDGLVLQLHRWDAEHHHGNMGDPALPVGNGALVWFEVDDFDAVVTRADTAHCAVAARAARRLSRIVAIGLSRFGESQDFVRTCRAKPWKCRRSSLARRLQ